MTQLTVAAPPMPGIAPAEAVAADATAGPAGDAAAALPDFAAVLKAHIGLAAKDASGTEIIAAFLPPGAAQSGEEPLSAAELPVAPDLTALLPALAGLMPSPATEVPLDERQGHAETEAAQPLPAFMSNAGTPTANPPLPAAVPAAEESLRPTPQPAFPAIGGADALPNEAAAVSVAEPQLPAIVAELQLPAIDAEQSPVSAQAAQVAVRAHAAPEGELPRPLLRVVTPVGSRSWDAEFGQKIVLLAGRQESRAELTLAPPHMGRVEITLSVNGDQTSAAFVSASPAAREAIEQALPRLREVLAEAGITLGQASVNAESAGRDRSGTPAQRHGRDDANGIAAGAASSSAPLRRSNGLIDTFA